MRAPLVEERRSGCRVAQAGAKKFSACLQLRALPAGVGGAFHDDRPSAFPRFDGEEVGGKPQPFQQCTHGGFGLCQIGYAELCHGSIAAPMQVQQRVHPVTKRLHESPPQETNEKICAVSA